MSGMLLKRGMGNGEWGMGNGEWGMGNGEWEIENGKLIFFVSLFHYLKLYLLLPGWSVSLVKNCDRGLENVAPLRPLAAFFKPEVTVFYFTDRL